MTLDEAYAWTRAYGEQVGLMVKRGDALATKLFAAYSAFWSDQKNHTKQAEFIKLVQEYGARNLYVTERVELARKFGIDDEQKREQPKIIVPGSYGNG